MTPWSFRVLWAGPSYRFRGLVSCAREQSRDNAVNGCCRNIDNCHAYASYNTVVSGQRSRVVRGHLPASIMSGKSSAKLSSFENISRTRRSCAHSAISEDAEEARVELKREFPGLDVVIKSPYLKTSYATDGR